MKVISSPVSSRTSRLAASGGDDLGARVRLETDTGAAMRTVQSAYGYCSASEARVYFDSHVRRVERVFVALPRPAYDGVVVHLVV